MKETISLIIQILTLLGIIFAIYKYFRTPDENAEKAIILLKSELREQKAMTTGMIKTNQNCIHTLENKIEGLTKTITGFNIDITKLGTIIEERIPKKL